MKFLGDPADFDVVIVGGGVAGLAAARNLRGTRFLLVEAEQCLGGRVKTVHLGEYAVELGAVFPSRRLCQWLGGNFQFLTRNPVIALHCSNGDLVVSGSRAELLAACATRADLSEIQSALFAATHFVASSRFNRFAQRVLQGDPGRAALGGGMVRLVDALAAGGSSVLHARADSLRAGGGTFSLTTRDEFGNTQCISARAMILACGFRATKSLLESAQIAEPEYLRGLASVSVEVIIFKARSSGDGLPGYAVSAAGDLIALVFSPTSDGACLITAYLRGETSADWTATDLELCLKEHVSRYSGDVDLTGVEILARHRWQDAVVPVADADVAAWSKQVISPCERLFLAGDYIYPGVSFGIEPAFITGVQAAERAKVNVNSRFYPGELSETAAIIANELASELDGVIRGESYEVMTALNPWKPPESCGDVVAVAAAVAGLRSHGAVRHEALVADAIAWLQNLRSSGMWPYTRGGLPTATDSALVSYFVPECDWREFLHEYETEAGVLPQLHSSGRRGERVMRTDAGNAHWCQADPFTTAICARWLVSSTAGHDRLSASRSRWLHESVGGLFVANPMLWGLALADSARFMHESVAVDTFDNLGVSISEWVRRGRFTNGIDPGISVPCAILALESLGLLESDTKKRMPVLLKLSVPKGNETPFFSARRVHRQQAAIPFHECGDVLNLPNGRFDVTFYRDTKRFVAAGLWLMAESKRRVSSDVPLFDLPSRNLEAPGSEIPLYLRARNTSEYCALILRQLAG